jgi:PAS domain S-box-containing protein
MTQSAALLAVPVGGPDAHAQLESLRRENQQLRVQIAAHENQRRMLVQQQSALRTVISSIPYHVFWKDRQSVYLGCNEAFARSAGLEHPDEVPGKTDWDLPWKQEETEFFLACDQAVMRDAKPLLDLEEPLLDADGTQRVILTSKVPLRDEAGEVIGMLGIYTDISARKQLELDLQRAKDSAEAANRAKSDFLAAVSHELRTPLTLVLGPLDVLRGATDLPAEARAVIERVRRNACRLKDMVDDILDFTKSEAGMLVADEEPVDLGELVRSLVDDIRPGADARGLRLSGEVAATGTLVIDRRMFEKIVLNLVGNALKFTPPGGQVSVELHVGDAELELAVRDSGIGIAQADLGRLFQRFQQLDTSSSRRYDGTGLGLALVKQFAERMGGCVGVESELGRGSRFFVKLPLRRGPAAAEAVQRHDGDRWARAAADARIAASNPPLPVLEVRDDGRRCVVVVEDNPELRVYIQDLLAADYRVIACASGSAALAATQQHQPDVVVSDVMIPDMDGDELLARIKGDPGLSATPVILVTANASRDAMVSSLGRGADDFLTKPFSPDELRARVAVAVRLRAATRTLAEKNAELVRTRDMLIESEKMSALGSLLAQLSHEINNPLCVMLGNLEPMGEYITAVTQMLDAYEAADTGRALAHRRRELEIDYIRDEFPACLGIMREAVQRVIAIQQDLRMFLRGEAADRIPGELNTGLKATIDMVKRGLSTDVLICTSYGELPTTHFNLGQLKQVFLNLLQNAVHAVGRRGTITITSYAEHGRVIISFADTGHGIPPELRSKIFEPFFTTKEAGTGSGLGLAVSKQIIVDHGGTLRLDTEAAGTCFVIELPISRAP